MNNDLLPEDDAFVRTALRGLRPPDHHHDFWDVLAVELDLAVDVMAAHGLLVEPDVAPLVVDLPRGHQDAERIEWNPAASPVEPGPRPIDAPHPPRRAPLRADAEPARPARTAAATGRPTARPPERHAAREAAPARVRVPAPAAPAAAAAATGTRGTATVAAARAGAAVADATAVAPRPVPFGARPVRPAPPAETDPARLLRHRPKMLVDPDLVDHDPAVVPTDMRKRSNAVLVAVAAAAAAIAVLAGLALVKQRAGAVDDPAQAPTEQTDSAVSGP